ncbi:aminodeoxychorismate synthase component I [Arachidicoccus terrestris]|uniref:aminodeoxychorismate synthase component I n=1 Tax=Arachidicoccus terrestris TaxID=2875539 RepID=UPI001CC3ED8A|nr:aminodeoxychorismate synthase component I [Arachidicoccus terrestris]UAY54265.1 aminodeoxychorismate synthase component I [Arachidicoccus terrestris]
MITDTKEVFFDEINKLYQAKQPFFFLTDYDGKQMEVTAIDEKEEGLGNSIRFRAPGMCFPKKQPAHLIHPDNPLIWHKHPISFAAYKKSFEIVQQGLQQGNSYLVNLTCSTPVDTNYSLADLYELGQGKYKLLYRDWFVHFSPEPFIRIENDRISSYPMKGTIEDSEPDAADRLRLSEKEIAEQYTIVDLIRNDLHQVAAGVEVASFRYLEKLKTNQKNLYTVSSHITGTLRPAYLHNPGDVLKAMLPAGSITGAPKAATIKIIRQAETHRRNFYTGVWGYYNGQILDSCVIIRYLESTPEGLIFKSGGGITSLSEAETEYHEMITKVYVPLP